jgi:uncharacterized protein (DUF1778 family)
MNNKSESFHIRLDSKDRELLEKAAEYSKLSLTAYVRMVILKDAERRIDLYERIREMKK